MDDMTIRDPDAMERFASEIYDYSANMKKVCRNLETSITAAHPLMKDEISQKALKQLADFVIELMAGLPEAESVAEMLVKSAAPLKQARTLL